MSDGLMNNDDGVPTDRSRFALDSDVFLESFLRWYRFEFAPGFWEALLREHRAGRVFSVRHVRNELTDREGKDPLVEWIDWFAPQDGFFLLDDTAEVQAEYAAMMAWVYGSDHYSDGAKRHFANFKNADGWLVAAAKAHRLTVVTQEKRNREKKSGVPIPVLCEEFGVNCVKHLPDAGGVGRPPRPAAPARRRSAVGRVRRVRVVVRRVAGAGGVGRVACFRGWHALTVAGAGRRRSPGSPAAG